MIERRKFNRYGINIPAVIEFILPDKDKNVKVYQTINISAGGAYIHASPSLREGTAVKVDLLFQFDKLKTPANPRGELKIAVSGFVSRTDSDGMAICFHENYEAVLHEILRSR